MTKVEYREKGSEVAVDMRTKKAVNSMDWVICIGVSQTETKLAHHDIGNYATSCHVPRIRDHSQDTFA